MEFNNLQNCFTNAILQDKKYVGVKIEMEGFPKAEIIINDKENFESKFAYYKKAYDENLVLKSFNGIKIVGFAYGDSFEEIEYELIG